MKVKFIFSCHKLLYIISYVTNRKIRWNQEREPRNFILPSFLFSALNMASWTINSLYCSYIRPLYYIVWFFCAKAFHLIRMLWPHYYTSINYSALLLFRRVRKIAKSDLASTCLSVCLSGRMEHLGLAHNGRIFIKLDVWLFFENLARKFKHR